MGQCFPNPWVGYRKTGPSSRWPPVVSPPCSGYVRRGERLTFVIYLRPRNLEGLIRFHRQPRSRTCSTEPNYGHGAQACAMVSRSANWHLSMRSSEAPTISVRRTQFVPSSHQMILLWPASGAYLALVHRTSNCCHIQWNILFAVDMSSRCNAVAIPLLTYFFFLLAPCRY